MAERPLVALKKRIESSAAAAALTGEEGDAPRVAAGADDEDGQGEGDPLPGSDANEGDVDESDPLVARGIRLANEKQARKYGWTDRDTYVNSGRDPAEWRDAETFLEFSHSRYDKMRKRLKDSNERVERNAQAAAAAIEEANRTAREAARREVDAAAEAGDPERIRVASKKLTDAVDAGPPPETVAWIAKNPWFNLDPIAQAAAVAETNRLAAQKVPVAQQLQAAEALVRKRFPEHFQDDLDDELEPEPPPPAREERRPEQRQPAAESERGERPQPRRLSDVRTPVLESGSRARPTRSREKGFADIPAADQALYQKHFARQFAGRMKPEEAEARYAKSYWAGKA